MRRTCRAAAAVALTSAVISAGTAPAFADELRDTILADGGEQISLTEGSATGGDAKISVHNQNNDGDSGCNLDGNGEKITVSIVTPTGVTATPSSFDIVGCGGNDAKTVTFTAATGASSGNATATVTYNNTGSGVLTNLVSIPISIVAANTRPKVVVSGVDADADYVIGNVPEATCTVTDAETSEGPFAAGLSGTLTNGLGSQTATCDYTDPGGLVAETDSVTYNIVAPPNTAPSVSVEGVSNGASYNKGAVPAAACVATDAEDGPTAPTAVLSVITGTYASDGIGSQTATCNVTDLGGLSATPAVATYSIVDPSAPSIDYDLTPEEPNGSNGWYNSGAVELDWTVSELESPNSLTKIGCVDQNVTADQAAVTYSCDASSAGGNADQVDVTIRRDATRPTLTGTPQGTATNGWYTGDVTVAWAGNDNLSGIDENTVPDDDTVTGEGNNLSTGAVTVFDLAGNESLSTTKSGIKIDRTAPTSTVSGVTANAVYATAPTVTCSATDQTGLSGVAGHGTITGNTTSAGLKTVSCNGATDNAGNTQTVSSASVSYTLAPLSGLNSNFDSTTNVLKVKPNQAIPLKWAFNDGTSNHALLGSAATLSSVTSTRCTSATGSEGSEVASEIAAGASGLQLLPDGSYQMNWKATSTTGCRALTVTAPYASGVGSFTRTILVNITK